MYESPARVGPVKRERRVATMRGIVRRLGLEGGVWALVTDDGKTIELIDAPAELRTDGARFEVEGDRSGADVSIGMVGDAMRVKSFKRI